MVVEGGWSAIADHQRRGNPQIRQLGRPPQNAVSKVGLVLFLFQFLLISPAKSAWLLVSNHKMLTIIVTTIVVVEFSDSPGRNRVMFCPDG